MQHIVQFCKGLITASVLVLMAMLVVVAIVLFTVLAPLAFMILVGIGLFWLCLWGIYSMGDW